MYAPRRPEPAIARAAAHIRPGRRPPSGPKGPRAPSPRLPAQPHTTKIPGVPACRDQLTASIAVPPVSVQTGETPCAELPTCSPSQAEAEKIPGGKFRGRQDHRAPQVEAGARVPGGLGGLLRVRRHVGAPWRASPEREIAKFEAFRKPMPSSIELVLTAMRDKIARKLLPKSGPLFGIEIELEIAQLPEYHLYPF